MDDDLIAATAAGDDGALRAVRPACTVGSRLRRALPADAVEDVLQETFIAVWRGAPSYSGRGDVGAWIWSIARRQATLWARKHLRPLPPWLEAGALDPAAQRAWLERHYADLRAGRVRLDDLL